MSPQSSVAEPERLLPRSIEDRLLGALARAAGFALCLAAAAGWLALLTWSVNDPSLTHATSGPTSNILGTPGAVLSDLLLQTLGFAAVFALLTPMFWGIELALAEQVSELRYKACLFPVAVLLLAGGCSALPPLRSWPLHHGLGGIIGDVVFNLAHNVLASINADRAGLAGGVLFFAAGAGALIKCLGLTSRDLSQLIGNGGRDRKPIARRGFHWRSRFSWLSRRRPEPTMEPGLGPGFAPQFSPPAPAAGGGGWNPGPSYGSQPIMHSHYQAPPMADGIARMPPPTFLAEGPLSGRTVPPPLRREPGFDNMTDRESRAIAERFANPGEPHAPGQLRKAVGMLGAFANRRAQPGYKRPSLNLLKRATAGRPGAEFTQPVLKGTARLLIDVLADFGVKGEIKEIRPGPVVTLFELEPARGTKSSRVIGLADDIARSMSATSVRVAVVPGRNAIGIELPNPRRETVYLREILESEAFRASEAALPMTLGKSIGGEAIVTDLARMPHLLVAGTTGSGKSVGVNAMILSLLYRHAPEDCRFLMIDPKMLELSVYNGIPHLLTPVVTDPQKAVAALNWAVSEMEERYKRMAELGVRNIDVFNNRVRNSRKRGEMLARTLQTGFDAKTGQAVYEKQQLDLEPMPYIVVVVDEFADLMIVAGKEIEGAVQRLAQMARAAGIHLIMATQRPSVDIITGTIKANFPTRISFKVTSKIDSRTILNEQGAEQLLGQGDMLFSGGSGQVVRVHGPFVSDEEVEAIVTALREQGEPSYVTGITDEPKVREVPAGDERASEGDDLYDRAVAVVLRDRKASTSYIQRRLSIGYNRAADLIERMERDGIVGPANNVGKRDILVAGPDAPPG